ncbi:MAG: 50S ribosomal protein L11 methyltransferase [Gammaproteobacteria bacterium]|nr:50S ribosomal protein L11 methyltransferase [Gammaproteobacteria bacterium]
MTWRQLSLSCQASELEQVEDLMLELGALSISLCDAGDEPIYEPLPGDNPVWQESIVTATFSENCDHESLARLLAARLPQHLAATVTGDSFHDQDWIQAYRRHFKPLQVAPDLWIVPSWLDPPDPRATNIRLDPGLAFGTGSHPTTAQCLAWLATQNLDDLAVIDFGCGSGILAIAAIKLGARQVLAVDIDELALGACKSNMAVNAVDTEQIRVSLPTSADTDAVDLLLANILAGPLLDLAERFAGLVKPGGKILLSGILQSQLNNIQSAYSNYFKLDPASCRDGWVCISGSRL